MCYPVARLPWHGPLACQLPPPLLPRCALPTRLCPPSFPQVNKHNEHFVQNQGQGSAEDASKWNLEQLADYLTQQVGVCRMGLSAGLDGCHGRGHCHLA